MPESFKVFGRNFQSLGMDVGIIDEEAGEMEIREAMNGEIPVSWCQY